MVAKERVDDTGFGAIKVIQQPGLGYGVDAILLAAFAAGETGARPIAEGSYVADLGTGSGIVAMVVAYKIPHTSVCGIELRADSCDRARRAIELSELEDRVSVDNIDVADIANGQTKHDGMYDAVVSNPPYFKKNAAIPSETSGKYIARHETSAELKDFLKAAARMLKDGGSLYMVHRPDRMVDILSEMRLAGLEPKELQLVVPRTGEAANIMLVHGIKGGGAELKMLPEIPVHEEGQRYTNIINRIYERRINL